MGNSYPAYTTIDTTHYATPTFKYDSATIIGCYRNLDKGFNKWKERFFPSPFNVSLYNFILSEDATYKTDIDELGRFKITFPIMNTESIFVDWKRTHIKVVMEPNDTLFIFADINDYIPTCNDNNYSTYLDRNKQVLFMGHNARVNNEIYQYKGKHMEKKKGLKDDIAYIHAYQKEYNANINHLNKYIETHPTLSSKFHVYQQKIYKHEYAFHLMQNAYNINFLSDEYMSFIENNFTFNDNLDFTFTVYFPSFIRDYVLYLSKRIKNIHFNDIANKLRKEGKITPINEELVETLNILEKKINSASDEEKKEIFSQIEDKINILNQDSLVKITVEKIYKERIKYANTTILLEELNERISYDGKMTTSINKQINDLNTLEKQYDKTIGEDEKKKLHQAIISKTDTLNSDTIIRTYCKLISTEKNYFNAALVDSIFSNPNLKELWTANRYISWFENLHKPVSKYILQTFYQLV